MKTRSYEEVAKECVNKVYADQEEVKITKATFFELVMAVIKEVLKHERHGEITRFKRY